MNWQRVLAFVGAALTAGGQAVPGLPGWIMTGIGAGALYLTRPSQTSKIADKLSKKIPGKDVPLFPDVTP